MHPNMSQTTRQEVLAKKRDRYARAGKEHKTKIINELIELFGYYRKAAIRALKLQLANETVDTVCTGHGGCTPKGLGRNQLTDLVARL